MTNAAWALRWGTWSAQGRRESMEDRIAVQVSLDGHSDSALFAVFDGHVGHRAAKFASKHFALAFLGAQELSSSALPQPSLSSNAFQIKWPLSTM